MAQPVLEILDGDRAGDVVSLGDNALRIGRKSSNDLVLPDEKASGVHAEVVCEAGRFVLRDLGSTNGTLMEGRRVSEVVLSNGDTFAIGRVKLRFRGEAGAADDAMATGLEVGRIDTSRLAGKSGRPVGLLVALLVVAVGAGGYLLWQNRGDGENQASAQRPQQPLQVAGNQLPGAVGACESDEGWQLRVAGSGFTVGGVGHTGLGGLQAQRLPLVEGEEPAEGASADARGFAVAASDEVEVLAGRKLRLVSWLLTEGQARVAVRLHFFRAADVDSGAQAFHFRSGTALQSYDQWTEASVELPVPVGADRCQVEVVAVLPEDGSAAVVDDVALTELGQGAGLQARIGESAVMLLGTGESLALRSSVDSQRPVTLSGLAPGAPTADLKGLDEAGLLTLSDVGAKVTESVDDRSCTITVEGADGVELQFPSDSTSGLLVATKKDGADQFVSAAAQGSFETDALLLGDRANRCMIELDEGATLQGRTRKGVYLLRVPESKFRIVVGFRDERQQAVALLREAQRSHDAGQPREALDAIAQLSTAAPHDVETLTRALELRAKINEELGEELARIGKDLEEAQFFDTRGGFERVVRHLDALQALYGEHNLTDPESVARLREQAASQLAVLEGRRGEKVRERLELMASAFELQQRKGLAELVRDYIAQYLPKPSSSDSSDQSAKEGGAK
ncbi:MAG: FHA domain-containing protein [Planctomycetota bacterium]|nr:FHA domain-containing protein [Planctomycetota bacterium]